MLRKHFRIRRLVVGLAFAALAALAAPAGASAAGTFVDEGPVPVSHVSTVTQVRTEHSAPTISPMEKKANATYATITPLQADGLRWHAMAARYQAAMRAQQAISERSNGVPGPNPSLVPQVVLSTTSNSFSWRDAGIGASSAFGVALILLIAVALIRRNQHAGLTRA